MRYLFFSNQTWQEPAEFPHRLLPFLIKERGKISPPEHARSSAPANYRRNRFPREAAPLTIAAVGAGGKTSLLMQLMKECLQLGLRVMVTTTTHMFLPKTHLTSAAFTGIQSWSQSSPISCSDSNPVFLGNPVNPPVLQEGWVKCSAPDPELFWKLYPDMDVVLVEADGSKRFPVKIPASWEPVIPGCTDLILAIYGLSSLGKTLGESCHRWTLLGETFPASHPDDLSRQMLSSRPDDSCQKPLSSWQITPKLLGTLMKQNYLDPLGKKYGYPSVIPVWNQADTQELTEAAKIAAACCGASLQLITAF